MKKRISWIGLMIMMGLTASADSSKRIFYGGKFVHERFAIVI